jgi:tRNA threonylcarbamoyladenosine biosynthesis protein TsaB
VTLLALDTSTAQVAVALGDADGILAAVALAGRRRHAEQITPAIEFVLDQAGRAPSDLAAVAVGVGPGLFTGLRVGVTTAKVMAQALGVPVVAVSSLDVVAEAVADAGTPVVAVLDARRDEVYAAVYRPGGEGPECSTPERVLPPAALAAELAAEFAHTSVPVLFVGEGALIHGDVFAAVPGARLASPTFARPDPAALFGLAWRRFDAGVCAPPGDVRPHYLRQSDTGAVAAPKV